MRLIPPVAVACLLALPAFPAVHAEQPMAPVAAVGTELDTDGFKVQWTTPVSASQVQGFYLVRRVEGLPAGTYTFGADVRFYVDPATPTGTVTYVVYWFNDTGLSPASNPVLRGEWPECSPAGVSATPPGFYVAPQCITTPDL